MSRQPPYECSEETFMKDVAAHEMTIFQMEATGMRRIRYARPMSSVYAFTIVTFPGHLVYTGDMGTYVFSRIEDMFQFFRHKPGSDPRYRINPQYWAEKILAEDRHNKVEVYDEDAFASVIREKTKGFLAERYGDSGEWFYAARNLWPEVKEQVLRQSDNEHDARDAALRFRYEDGFRHEYGAKIHSAVDRIFEDLWDHNLKKFGFHYIWSCYAIVWAIEQYDKLEPR